MFTRKYSYNEYRYEFNYIIVFFFLIVLYIIHTMKIRLNMLFSIFSICVISSMLNLKNLHSFLMWRLSLLILILLLKRLLRQEIDIPNSSERALFVNFFSSVLILKKALKFLIVFSLPIFIIILSMVDFDFIFLAGICFFVQFQDTHTHEYIRCLFQDHSRNVHRAHEYNGLAYKIAPPPIRKLLPFFSSYFLHFC